MKVIELRITNKSLKTNTLMFVCHGQQSMLLLSPII